MRKSPQKEKRADEKKRNDVVFAFGGTEQFRHKKFGVWETRPKHLPQLVLALVRLHKAFPVGSLLENLSLN